MLSLRVMGDDKRNINSGAGINSSLDALIADGLTLQGTPVELERLVHEGMNQVLGVQQEAGVLHPIPEGVVVHQTNMLASHPGTVEVRGHVTTDVTSQVRDSGTAVVRTQQYIEPLSAPMSEDDQEVDQDDTGDENDAGDDGNENGSSGRPARGTKRKKGGRRNQQGMQGRFSGRLETKGDEKRLADECRLLGPYLSGVFSGEKSLQTLAKIVRGIASGEVRQYVEARERELQELRQRLDVMQNVPDHKLTLQLHDEVAKLQAELQLRNQQVAVLERDLAAANSRLQNVAAAATGQPPPAQIEPSLSGQGVPALGNGSALQQQQQQQPQQPQGVSPTMSISQAAVPVVTAAVHVPLIHAQPTQLASTSLPLSMNSLSIAQQAQQQQIASQQQPQVLSGALNTNTIHAQQVVPQSACPLGQTTVNRQGSGVPLPESMAALTGQTQPQQAGALLTGSQPLSQQGLSGIAGASPAFSGDLSKSMPSSELGSQVAPVVKQENTTVLQDQVQHLAVQASLHGQAKNQAENQAQQLAQQANLHAQASVQAAVQAEQLKKTLAVLPDTDHSTQQAVATVESLEARAQAHAEITAQAVQQARDLQEQAQAHAQEQAKAIAHATILQVQAQTLQGTSQQSDGKPSPGMALSSGAEPQPQLTPTPSGALQSQPALNGGQQILTLGGPSDVQMAHELGLLPTSPLSPASHGNNGNSLLSCSGMSGQQGGHLSAPPAALIGCSIPSMLQPSVQQVLPHGQEPGVQPANSAQLVSGAAGLQNVGSQPVTLIQQQQQQQQQQQNSAAMPGLSKPHMLLPSAPLGSAPPQLGAAVSHSMPVLSNQAGFNGGVVDTSPVFQQQQSGSVLAAAAPQHTHQHQAASIHLQEQLEVLQQAQQQQLATQTAANSAAQEQLAVAVAAQQHQQQMATAAAIVQGQLAALQHQPVDSVAQQDEQAVMQQAMPVMPPNIEQHVNQPLHAQSGLPPLPPASGSIMQQVPHSMQHAVSANGSLGASRNVSSSELVERTLSTRGSGSLVQLAQQAPSESMQGCGNAFHCMPVSKPAGNGRTPSNRQSLDLPPGMESVLPSGQPLSMDPASLTAAAAMAPVVSIPGDSQ